MFARCTSLTLHVGLQLDGDALVTENFPLPTLGAKLKVLNRDVHQGKGFCVVRGVDTNRYPVEDLTLIYLGIQAYIANERGRQDKKGNMLGMSNGPQWCSNSN